MIANVSKWGNSLAVRIPRDAARQLQLAEGAEVDLVVEDGAFVVRPVRRAKYDLESLLAGITHDNLPEETATGTAVGDEL